MKKELSKNKMPQQEITSNVRIGLKKIGDIVPSHLYEYAHGNEDTQEL